VVPVEDVVADLCHIAEAHLLIILPGDGASIPHDSRHRRLLGLAVPYGLGAQAFIFDDPTGLRLRVLLMYGRVLSSVNKSFGVFDMDLE
jgi:hypothetical protein